MVHVRTTLTALLLCTLTACAPVPEDGPQSDHDDLVEESADPALSLRAEQDGARIPAATFESHDDPAERQRIEQIRAESCEHDARAGSPGQRVPLERAEGVTAPRFRVVEDQRQASLDLQTDDDEGEAVDVPAVRAETIEAQARYLAEATALEAGWVGSAQELAQARAELKDAELGEP